MFKSTDFDLYVLYMLIIKMMNMYEMSKFVPETPRKRTGFTPVKETPRKRTGFTPVKETPRKRTRKQTGFTPVPETPLQKWTRKRTGFTPVPETPLQKWTRKRTGFTPVKETPLQKMPVLGTPDNKMVLKAEFGKCRVYAVTGTLPFTFSKSALKPKNLFEELSSSEDISSEEAAYLEKYAPSKMLGRFKEMYELPSLCATDDNNWRKDLEGTKQSFDKFLITFPYFVQTMQCPDLITEFETFLFDVDRYYQYEVAITKFKAYFQLPSFGDDDNKWRTDFVAVKMDYEDYLSENMESMQAMQRLDQIERCEDFRLDVEHFCSKPVNNPLLPRYL